MSTPSMELRPMRADDAPAVAALLPQLGYPASAADARRLAGLRGWPDLHVALACTHGAAVGLVHAQGVRLLASDGYAEIQALVVAPTRGRQDIGAGLLRHAEARARGAGYGRVRLRSGLHREAAHACQRALGSEAGKASLAFERRP